MEKQKNVLPLEQQMEWQQLFEEEKAIMQKLAANIKSTDQAIDKLMYFYFGTFDNTRATTRVVTRIKI